MNQFITFSKIKMARKIILFKFYFQESERKILKRSIVKNFNDGNSKKKALQQYSFE